MKLTRFLQGYGLRVQLSAFECQVPHGHEEEFARRAFELVDPAEDRLTLYPLCPPCRGRIRSVGKPLGAWPEGDTFII
ncbi:CRISPR-associated endoribonuclease Cas2 3 [compost metagenome]